MNLFSRTGQESGDPKTWVFEQNIYNVIIKKLNRKMLKKEIIWTVFIFALTLYCFLLHYGTGIAKAIVITLIFEIILILVIHVMRNLKKGRIMKYLPMVIVPLISLTITIGVVKIYPDGSMPVQRADILSFCGDFLTFLGAFCLGYFIYIQDRTRIIEEKRTKVKLLSTLIENAESELLKLDRLNRSKKNNLNNLGLIQSITYDSNWPTYYFEYEAIKGKNSDLRTTLKRFFNYIIDINTAIRNGQIDTAINIYKRHIDNDNYSISKYNTLEAKLCLADACLDFYGLNTKSWIERKETINLINELCRKYYFMIENYVYNWLLKHRISTTNDEYDLQREVVDWLLTQSPEIKEIIKYPPDKRIITSTAVH